MNRSREIGMLKSRVREIEARCFLLIKMQISNMPSEALANTINVLEKDTLVILKDILDLESEFTNR